MILRIFFLLSFKHSQKKCIPKKTYYKFTRCWTNVGSENDPLLPRYLREYKSQDPQKPPLKLDLSSEVNVLPVGPVPRKNSDGMWSINCQCTKKHLVISLLQDKVQQTYMNLSLCI